MSRSYPEKEPRMWRMYCDSCTHVDPDRFPKNEMPPLEHYVAKGWFIGVLNDRCPQCRERSDLKPMEMHSVMVDSVSGWVSGEGEQ